MTILQPPAYLQGGEYSAVSDRMHLITARFLKDTSNPASARGGVLPMPDLWSAMTSVVGFQATIGPFHAIVQNTFAANSGDYEVISYDNEVRNLTGSSPTTNRIDIIGVQVFDSFYAGADVKADVVVIQGTATAGTPADPVLPASFEPFYRYTVNANSTTPIVTDLRRRTALSGAVCPIFVQQVPNAGSYPGEIQLLPAAGGAPARQRVWTADGRWMGLNSFAVATGAIANGGVATFTSPFKHATIAIPDPGYSYRLKVWGQYRMSMGTNTGIDVKWLDGDGTGGAVLFPFQSLDGRQARNQAGAGSGYGMFEQAPMLSTSAFVGARTISLVFSRWQGGGGDGWTLADAGWTKLWAEVVPS